ncbi:MAG TPA: DinB family protein [Candidatus Kapabacteria bacterium]|nr:DinB family protein [Candidatus Kapabacteria bacterium]
MNPDTTIQLLQSLFERDIRAAINEIESMPEVLLWTAPHGVTNTAGVLAQHLAGNLQHFIGHGIGGSTYVRNREQEFEYYGRTKNELLAELERARQAVAAAFNGFGNRALDAPFPIPVPPLGIEGMDTVGGFLLQLHFHLAYHLGQLNYLRRILAS